MYIFMIWNRDMETKNLSYGNLTFGNDMSRIVRGIAIILMVCNHSMPGKVIGFAVPLFSFLVGYGYAFAKKRGASHSLSRIWHLLRDYWFVIFAICLPAALISYHKPLAAGDIALAMFGMNPCLNCFCWYIYFYIFAMLTMPGIARVVDRFSWKGTLAVALGFGALYWWIQGIAPADRIWGWNIAYRVTRYMPVVAVGYLVAKRNLVSLVRLPKSPLVPVAALAVMTGVYFLRGLDYAKILDCLWAPLFAFATAALFKDYTMKPIRGFLTQMGLKSMNIWFLHALFFTASTKGLFYPLVGWIHWTPGYVAAILGLSYLFAVTVDGIMRTWGRGRAAIVRFARR